MTIVTFAGVFALTLAARLISLRSAYDVFLDETIYARLAAGVAQDGQVSFAGVPFFLHPPLYFYVQAGYLRLTGASGTAVQYVHELRLLNVIIASVMAVVILQLVANAAGRRLGLLAAALFALDPFVIRFDSRVFLETFATLWIALGYLGLQRLMRASPEDRQRAWVTAAVAGTFFGLALLSKETSAPLYVLPLLFCLVRDAPIKRRDALIALIALIVVYLPYPVVSVLTGGGHEFADQKLHGILRLLGAVQDTGFNKTGAPSFASRITVNLTTFGATYAFIGLGTFCAVWLFCRGTDRQRLLALWLLGAEALLAYQITRGTLEEQMFYYLVVPAIVVACVALPAIAERSAGPSALWRVPLAAFLAAVVVFDAAAWVKVRRTDDVALVQAVTWMEHHAPAGAKVAPLADGSQLLMPKYRLVFNPESGPAVTPQALQRSGADYVLTSSLQVQQGYSTADTRLVAWLRQHARQRYRSKGRTMGTLTIWQMHSAHSAGNPPGPESLRPRKPLGL